MKKSVWGAHLFDVEKFGCEWAYTMDGGEVGELEFENFNAAAAKVTVRGLNVHPGYAKGKMRNSMLVAAGVHPQNAFGRNPANHGRL